MYFIAFSLSIFSLIWRLHLIDVEKIISNKYSPLLFHQIMPPWKPDLADAGDTKYIPEEFAHEPVRLTPPSEALDTIEEQDELPYFESFSYHGPSSRGSLGSYLSAGAGAFFVHWTAVLGLAYTECDSAPLYIIRLTSLWASGNGNHFKRSCWHFEPLNINRSISRIIFFSFSSHFIFCCTGLSWVFLCDYSIMHELRLSVIELLIHRSM